MRSSHRFIVVAGLFASACSKPSDPSASRPNITPAPAPVAANDETKTETGTETGDDEVMPQDWESETIIEINAGGSETKGNTLVVTPIEPVDITAEWREVASFGPGVELVYVATGVLARDGNKLLVLGGKRDKHELVVQPDLQLPAGELLGDWPGDVWAHEATVRERVTTDGGPRVEHRVWRYDGHGWTPQQYKKQDSWTATGLELRKSWQSGFMIRDGSRVTRLGTTRDTVKIGPRMGKEVVAIIETRSGRIYSISERTNGLYAQRNCLNFTCVEENAIKLPHGKQWSFPMQVPRQRHSVSMVAMVQIEGGAEGNHLLHYEIGGWKLESMVHRPRGIWPAIEGGLWTVVNDALWFRDSGGLWHEVALPKGATGISAALAEARGELWLAATIGGKGKVFATAADLEPPA